MSEGLFTSVCVGSEIGVHQCGAQRACPEARAPAEGPVYEGSLRVCGKALCMREAPALRPREPGSCVGGGGAHVAGQQ
ncbi:hypothetical protein NDU88_000714 [Pleurodeles waltl]|uniref:Uncharacterized protein n=1 Tax=Pleurodeles waltl TaxID=8319 RepID=A0AAV7S6G4_PLEWA|nr:hypothetical protein NDU88_000714 [Pleurodeles waltl]